MFKLKFRSTLILLLFIILLGRVSVEASTVNTTISAAAYAHPSGYVSTLKFFTTTNLQINPTNLTFSNFKMTADTFNINCNPSTGNISTTSIGIGTAVEVGVVSTIYWPFSSPYAKEYVEYGSQNVSYNNNPNFPQVTYNFSNVTKAGYIPNTMYALVYKQDSNYLYFYTDDSTANSTPTNIYRIWTTPATPIVSFSNITNTSLSLTVDTNGNPTNTAFNVYRVVYGSSNWTNIYSGTPTGNSFAVTDSGLLTNQKYTYKVVAVSGYSTAYDDTSYWDVTTSPNAPSSPSGLTATAVSQTQINLSWSTSSGATGYTIYRNGSQVTTTTSNSYNDTELTANTTYSYYVTAYNTGGTSGTSNTVSATTLPNAPPVPTGLTASAVSSSQINLNWSAASGATAYKIYRGGSYITSCTDTMYSSTGLSPSTTYSYYVKAYNVGGDSGSSSTVSATTPASTPTLSGLTAEDVKRLVKEALSESSSITSIKTSADGAKTSADSAKNILDGSANGGKSLAAIYDKVTALSTTFPTVNAIADAVAANTTIQGIAANTSEARNAGRKRAIKVVEGVPFKEVVYDELSGSPFDGITGNAVFGITATIPKTGLGITVIDGTITSTGIKIVVFGDRGIIFNVIEKPALNTIATVNFIE